MEPLKYLTVSTHSVVQCGTGVIQILNKYVYVKIFCVTLYRLKILLSYSIQLDSTQLVVEWLQRDTCYNSTLLNELQSDCKESLMPLYSVGNKMITMSKSYHSTQLVGGVWYSFCKSAPSGTWTANWIEFSVGDQVCWYNICTCHGWLWTFPMWSSLRGNKRSRRHQTVGIGWHRYPSTSKSSCQRQITRS